METVLSWVERGEKITGNDNHGKWTYHEYVTNGHHGYTISGGLLTGDDAVNRKARELGHDDQSAHGRRPSAFPLGQPCIMMLKAFGGGSRRDES